MIIYYAFYDFLTSKVALLRMDESEGWFYITLIRVNVFLYDVSKGLCLVVHGEKKSHAPQ